MAFLGEVLGAFLANAKRLRMPELAGALSGVVGGGVRFALLAGGELGGDFSTALALNRNRPRLVPVRSGETSFGDSFAK